MKTIYEFKRGDEIVRIKPSKPYTRTGVGDRSYMGEKMMFIGIANNHIYLKRTEPGMFGIAPNPDYPTMLSLDLWYGWRMENIRSGVTSKSQLLKSIIQKGIEIEDEDRELYELAEKLILIPDEDKLEVWVGFLRNVRDQLKRVGDS